MTTLIGGTYEPKQGSVYSDTNMLILTRRSDYVKCDVHFGPYGSDVEMFDVNTADMDKALSLACVKLGGGVTLQRLDDQLGPTATIHQRAYKMFFLDPSDYVGIGIPYEEMPEIKDSSTIY